MSEKQYILKYMTELIETLEKEGKYLKGANLNSVAAEKEEDIQNLKNVLKY